MENARIDAEMLMVLSERSGVRANNGFIKGSKRRRGRFEVGAVCGTERRRRQSDREGKREESYF